MTVCETVLLNRCLWLLLVILTRGHVFHSFLEQVEGRRGGRKGGRETAREKHQLVAIRMCLDWGRDERDEPAMKVGTWP